MAANMPLLEPEKKEKEGGGEEKGEEGGKEGEYWESCADAARSLKTSLSRAKWLGRPSNQAGSACSTGTLDSMPD